MLRRILLIAKRDYVAVVMQKGFLIGLIAMPLLFGAGFFGLALVRVTQGDRVRRVALIDRTEGAAASAAVIEAAREKRAEERGRKSQPQLESSNYVFELAGTDDRLALSDRVRRRELVAFIEIPADALHPGSPAGKVLCYTDSGSVSTSLPWLQDAINNGLRRERLARLGVDRSRFDEVFHSLPVEAMSLLYRDEKSGAIHEARSRGVTEALVPVVLMLLLLMMTLVGAASMLSAVAEDKTQRVFEMLLASATPFELMAGKVLASVAGSLTGSVFYVTGGLLILQGLALFGTAPLGLLPWFFVYVICQVTMLSALGAALGSACNTPRDAQQLAPLVIFPMMMPVFFLIPLMQEPNGVLTTVVSLLPPFTPAVMMLRQSMPGGPPAWQPWVGLVGVLVWTLAMIWAASRIFRVGLLMQGKPPRMGELVRWAVRG